MLNVNCPVRRPVLTKRDFVVRYAAGEFGNAAPTWDLLSECLNSGYSGRVHIRNRIAGGPTWYNIPMNQLDMAYKKLREMGVKVKNMYFSAMAPHHENVIQGEVQQSNKHLDLLYTDVKNHPMREALEIRQRNVSGAQATIVLRSCLCGNSYEWLNFLLESYPDHVIEFSTFNRFWGTVPRFNTVFWEVRKY